MKALENILTGLTTFIDDFARYSDKNSYDVLLELIYGTEDYYFIDSCLLGPSRSSYDAFRFTRKQYDEEVGVLGEGLENGIFRNRKVLFDPILIGYYNSSLEDRRLEPLREMIVDAMQKPFDTYYQVPKYFVLPIVQITFRCYIGLPLRFVLDNTATTSLFDVIDYLNVSNVFLRDVAIPDIPVRSDLFSALVQFKAYEEHKGLVSRSWICYYLREYFIFYILKYVPESDYKLAMVNDSFSVQCEYWRKRSEYFSDLCYNLIDYEFIIKMTPQWQVYEGLRNKRSISSGFFKMYPHHERLREMVDDLTRDGDVELNPGPVLSTMRANQQIARTAELQMFGLGNSLQDLTKTLSDGLKINLQCDEFKNKVEKLYPELFLLLVNLYRCRKDKITCCTVMAQFLVGFDFSLDVIYKYFNSLYGGFLKFINWISVMLNFSGNEATLEGDNNESDVVAKSFLSSVFSLFVPSGQSKNFLKYCGNLYTVDKGLRGFESLVNKILSYSKQIIDMISLWFYDTPTENFVNDLMNFNSRAVELLKLETRAMWDNEAITMELDELIAIGTSYYRILDGCKDKGLMDIFKVQFRQLQAMQLRFSKTGSPQKFKIPPYLITLFGESGVGKSQLTPYLLASLMAEDPYYKENPEKIKEFVKKVHFRQTENEYWDALQNSHDYLCIDDFGQQADKLNTQEYAELIRLSNTAPAKAHMSNVFEKGLVELDFKLIILTTNQKQPKTENITHPDAVRRRLEGSTWEVLIKKEFGKEVQTQGMSKVRLNQEAVGDHMNLSIYSFRKYNVHTGNQELEKDLNFEEFVAYHKLNYNKHKNAEGFRRDDLNSYLDTLCNSIIASNSNERTAELQIGWPFRSKQFSEEVNFIYDVLCKDLDIVNRVENADCTLMTKNLYDQFVDLRTDAQSKQFIEDHLEPFIILVYRMYPDDIVASDMYRSILNKQCVVNVNPSYKSLNRIGKMIKMLSEGVLAYVVVLGTFSAVYLAVYKFFECVYNWFSKGREITQVIPSFCFDYIEINGEAYFRGIDLDYVRDKFPEVLNWQLVSNYLVSHSKTSFKFRKNVSHSSQLYKYVMWVLECVKGDSSSCVDLESKYGQDVKGTVKTVLETNVDISKFDVNVRDKKILVGTLERYSTTIDGKNKVILENFLSSNKVKVDENSKVKTVDSDLEVVLDNNVDSVIKRTVNNQVVLLKSSEGALKKMGLGTFVQGRLMATFMHALPAMFDRNFFMRPVVWTDQADCWEIEPQNVTVIIPKHLKVQELRFKLSDLLIHKDEIFSWEFGARDMVLLDFSKCKSIPSYPSIVKHFVSVNDLSKVPNSKGILLKFTSGGTMVYDQILKVDSLDYPNEPVKGVIDYGGITGYTFVRDGYTYSAVTQSGDCGSLLFVQNQFIQGKILGFHVSGFADGMGNSVSVTQELLKSCITAENQICLDLDFLQVNETEYVPKGVFFLGKINDPVVQAGKSQITKSLVYNTRDVSKMMPAYLYPRIIDGVKLDPFELGMKKYYTVSPFISGDVLDDVFRDFSWFMKSRSSRFNKNIMRTFSLEEAVYGMETEKYWRSMPQSTSPGYSWPKNGFQGKRYYFQDGKIDDEVIDRVSERIKLAKEGIRKPHLYVCTLKDETRPIEKVKLGKTRVFTVPQMDYVLAVRMYFGGFAVNVMENRILNRSLVGINMYSLESNYFAKRLKKHPNILTGDFSNWDGSIRADIANKLLLFINSEYDRNKMLSLSEKKENNLVREVLFQDLINAMTLVGARAYLLTHSLPSGHPLTAIVNTLYNIFRSFLEYHLILLSKFKKTVKLTDAWESFVEFMDSVDVSGVVLLMDIRKYLDNVEGGFYGDDLVLSVSDKFKSFYNYRVLQRVNLLMGHFYTTSEKKEIIDRDFDQFDSANILKRYFKWDKDYMRFIAPLELSVVLEIPNWVKKGHDIVEQTVLNIEVAARELTLHDEKVYEDFVEDYSNILAKHGLYPYFQKYNLLKDRVLSGEYMEYLF